MKPWWYYKVRIVEEVRNWLYWKFTGWPFKQRCPQCTGNGRYISEAEARYHDAEDAECSMCAGTGRIKR